MAMSDEDFKRLVDDELTRARLRVWEAAARPAPSRLRATLTALWEKAVPEISKLLVVSVLAGTVTTLWNSAEDKRQSDRIANEKAQAEKRAAEEKAQAAAVEKRDREMRYALALVDHLGEEGPKRMIASGLLSYLVETGQVSKSIEEIAASALRGGSPKGAATPATVEQQALAKAIDASALRQTQMVAPAEALPIAPPTPTAPPPAGSVCAATPEVGVLPARVYVHYVGAPGRDEANAARVALLNACFVAPPVDDITTTAPGQRTPLPPQRAQVRVFAKSERAQAEGRIVKSVVEAALPELKGKVEVVYVNPTWGAVRDRHYEVWFPKEM